MSEKLQFARRLKELRAEAGLTQAALAKLAGRPRLSIAKLEQGLNEPGWGTVKALARALNISVAAFDEPEEPPKKRKKT